MAKSQTTGGIRMKQVKSAFINTMVDGDMKRLVDAAVSSSPGIGSSSALARHGLRLALRDAIDRGLIPDPSVAEEIDEYLYRSEVAIGESLSVRKPA
jgi:hypothetical protein